MGIFLTQDPAPFDPVVSEGLYDRLPSGIGASATFMDTLIGGPMNNYIHGIEQDAAANGQRTSVFRGPEVRLKPTTPVLTPDEANQRYGVEGVVKFEKPVRAAEAKLIQEWRLDQAKRQDVLRRADQGLTAGGIRLGAELLGSAVDPINLASAFVPVVGEARYAQLVGRLGVFGARLATGAVEGAVGAAAVEPIVYLQSRRELADYTAWDSLRNIAFGTVLGGGLHAGFGALSDFLGRQSFDARQTAVHASVAAIVEGRPVRVASIFDAMETRRAALQGSSTLGRGFAGSPFLAAEPGRPIAETGIAGFSGEIELPQSRPGGAAAIYPADKLGFKSEIKRLVAAAAKEGRSLTERALPDGRVSLVEPARLEVVDQYPSKRAAEQSIKRLAPADRAGLHVLPLNDADNGAGWAVTRGLSDRQAAQIEADPGLLTQGLSRGDNGVPVAPRVSEDLVAPPRGVAPADAPEAFRQQVSEIVRQTARDAVELPAETLAAIAEIDRVTQGWESGSVDSLEEAQALAAEIDRTIGVEAAAGRIGEGEKAYMLEANEQVALAEHRAAGIDAAVACMLRAA